MFRHHDYEIYDEGIHRYALNQDISFESFESGDPEQQGISCVFLTHPELKPDRIDNTHLFKT